ncbi:hypothetical protein BH780_gp160 [Bacillus phage Eldridge]|uniref:Uncharacterized protein n=1 Tax=Bacillus phage Eldridge TaxID=1776293 RepID=A0A120HUP2_9CAUD|nr:hypothetical protein BH780_gp160 [Bacillus phage Eldridge]AMB18743.1 hypothetical protein Eldridge_0163 [Bacillus phage Eldridge]
MKIDAAKMYFVLMYLQQGGRVYYEGRSLVWLDNYVVREDEKQQWIINGFAIEVQSYKSTKDVGNPEACSTTSYLGHDMSFSQFVKWVNNMSPVEYNRIIRKLAENKEEK